MWIKSSDVTFLSLQFSVQVKLEMFLPVLNFGFFSEWEDKTILIERLFYPFNSRHRQSVPKKATIEEIFYLWQFASAFRALSIEFLVINCWLHVKQQSRHSLVNKSLGKIKICGAIFFFWNASLKWNWLWTLIIFYICFVYTEF